MAEGNRPSASSATIVVLKVGLYYLLLLSVGWVVWGRIPRSGAGVDLPLETLFGITPPPITANGIATAPFDEWRLALTVAAAMIAAILLSLPVAWVYLLTRAKRGYQQSVVQLLMVLPLLIAGIVVLVKYSLALAFSLAGIVAAVRFRNTLEDSKDAVYVFLATAIGLSAAVNIPVAVVISFLFNATVLILWATDFGHSPMALDGKIAERRLRKAKELARTGTFVARIDEEVFRNMTRDQLEGVAERASKRARDSEEPEKQFTREVRLRIQTRDSASTGNALKAGLDDCAKRWEIVNESSDADGTQTLDYLVRLKPKAQPQDLVTMARAAAGQWIINVEVD